MNEIKTRLDAARKDLNDHLGIRDYSNYGLTVEDLKESVRNLIDALDDTESAPSDDQTTPLVLIEWVKSESVCGEWRSESDGVEDLKADIVSSVGYIIKETLRAVTIASHITSNEDRELCGIMIIPIGSIRNRKELSIKI